MASLIATGHAPMLCGPSALIGGVLDSGWEAV